MKPIKFKESNIVFGENQPEYEPLPALKFEGNVGEVITCWKLSLVERLRILFIGNLWVSTLTFNKPLNPSFVTTSKKDVIIFVDENGVEVNEEKEPLWVRLYEKLTGMEIPEYNKNDYKK